MGSISNISGLLIKDVLLSDSGALQWHTYTGSNCLNRMLPPRWTERF